MIDNPTHCPSCGDILLNKYLDNYYSSQVVLKTCTSKLNHKFNLTFNDTLSIITTICISINDAYYAKWHFSLSGYQNKLYLIKDNFDVIVPSINFKYITLPFFEPNLSNYPALIKKLKTYVVFS